MGERIVDDLNATPCGAISFRTSARRPTGFTIHERMKEDTIP